MQEFTGMYGRGKVQAIKTKEGLFCQSYDTVVCGIVRGKLRRYWGGYSKTTMAHVTHFVMDYNVEALKKGKRKIEFDGVQTWDAMDVEVCPIEIAA